MVKTDDQKNSNRERCLECGGPRRNGLDCWGQLGLILALEGESPQLYQVHFLTVASYVLQHPSGFTEDALSHLKTVFVRALGENLSNEQVRKVMGNAFEGARRVRERSVEKKIVSKNWPMTIFDAYVHNDGDQTLSQVKKWAESIRNTFSTGQSD